MGVLLQIPQYITFRTIGYPRKLPLTMTVSVTFNCNSRCKTCNIWKKKAKDLSLKKFDLIFKSLGKGPFWFTVSGGEPFLKEDIVEICQSIYKRCQPNIINIPTNGLLYKIIPGRVQQIVESCPKSAIVVNLSIDGIGNRHDEIRGVPGNWDKAMNTYNALRKLKYPNFELGIHSVISKYNVAAMPEIYEYITKQLKPDSYITEIAEERVELDTVCSGITPTLEEYEEVINAISSQYSRKKFNRISKITQAFRLRYYELVKQVLLEKRQIIRCYAGFTAAHILPDGDVWACCVKGESMGNLREVNYDFKKVWFSQKAIMVRQGVKNDGCYCPVANISYTDMLCHFPTLAKVGWRVLTT